MVSPLKNLVEFTKRRPPQVICMLCLLLLAVASLSFAFYVRHTDELLDNDAEESWGSFKKYLNGLKWCVRKSTKSYYSREEEATVAVSADATFNGTTKYSYVEGTVSLAGWRSKCSKPPPGDVKITFDIPNSGARQKVCITIGGPEEFLPRYTHSECFAGPQQKGNPGQLFFVKNQNGCTDGDSIEMKLNTDKRQDFAVYLNETDKSNIYVHLLWLSFVMLALVVVVVIYGMFASSTHGEK